MGRLPILDDESIDDERGRMNGAAEDALRIILGAIPTGGIRDMRYDDGSGVDAILRVRDAAEGFFCR